MNTVIKSKLNVLPSFIMLTFNPDPRPICGMWGRRDVRGVGYGGVGVCDVGVLGCASVGCSGVGVCDVDVWIYGVEGCGCE